MGILIMFLDLDYISFESLLWDSLLAVNYMVRKCATKLKAISATWVHSQIDIASLRYLMRAPCFFESKDDPIWNAWCEYVDEYSTDFPGDWRRDFFSSVPSKEQLDQKSLPPLKGGSASLV